MGRKPPPDATAEQVRAALRLVIDPEIGINIVDLGLVYGVEVADGNVRIDLTMTTAACPLGEHLTSSAEATVWQQVPGIRSVDVQLVWEPPWRPDMISDEAREQLGDR
jgi:metal-sulfur cluster biosynthetic enzyme